jgi:Flp pilus assembly secretin CpaC
MRISHITLLLVLLLVGTTSVRALNHSVQLVQQHGLNTKQTASLAPQPTPNRKAYTYYRLNRAAHAAQYPHHAARHMYKAYRHTNAQPRRYSATRVYSVANTKPQTASSFRPRAGVVVNTPLAMLAHTSTPVKTSAKTPILPRLSSSAYLGRLGKPSGYAMLNMPISPYVAMRTPMAMRPPSVTLRSTIQNDRALEVTVGKSKVINLPFSVARVAISDPTVAQALVISPTQLQLVGKQPGLVSLTLWNTPYDTSPQTYDVAVARDVSQLAKQLRNIDPNIAITPMPVENTVILTGNVDSPEVAQVAVQLAQLYFSTGKGGGGNSGGNGGGSAAGAQAGQANSQRPGSSLTGSAAANVVNLLKVKGRPSSKSAMVAEKLRTIDPNIQMDVVPGADGNEKVILSGRVRSANTVSRAINTASIFYGQPGIKVLTGPGGNGVRNTGSADFHTNSAFSNNLDTNILQGSVITDASGNVVSMMQVMDKPQIRCSIKFLDVSRKDLNQLGATLTGGGGKISGATLSGAQGAIRNMMDVYAEQSGSRAGGLAGNGSNSWNTAGSIAQTFRQGVTQVLTVNNQFTAALSAMIEKRTAKSLAEPTLTMLSGEKASFLAGGEIPVPVSGNNGQISVSFKEFGIRLNLIPTVTDEGKIHLQVAPEVSDVDPGNGIVASSVTIPGFRTRRMQTTLELDNKQTFVLAGLFNHNSIDTLSRFPGMSNVPVLGNFFRQKNGEKQDSEMVVVIQPEIIMPNDSPQTAINRP